MNTTKFNKIVKETFEDCKSTLTQKRLEYAPQKDRFHNFKESAKLLNSTPQKAAVGIAIKQFQSVIDLCGAKGIYGKDLIDEKIKDSINYLLLIKGILYEEYDEQYKKN